MNDVDAFEQTVVILTALDTEYNALHRHLIGVRVHDHEAGTRYEVGTLRGSRTRIALVLAGKGNLAAAALTERSIKEFRPAALLFVGVAGGLRGDIALGDVVVAEHIHAYHGGREDAGRFRPHPRGWSTAHALSQRAHFVNRSSSWVPYLDQRTPQRPTVHFGSIAAGEVVLNSLDGTVARQVRDHYADSAVIEMESAGVAAAAQLNGATPILTIRGVSDTAGGEKDRTDALGWQPQAAANAAAFAMALVAELGRNRPAMTRRPWVLSGLAAVVLVTAVSGLLGDIAVAPLAALAAISFWVAALVGSTTRRWHSRGRAVGVATAALTGVAAIVVATNLVPDPDAPFTVQKKSAYQLRASSDPLTNYGDKVDLDTGCPGWDSMHPRIGPSRCGELADLIIESTDVHSPDYKPRIIPLPNDQPASFETCRDGLASPAVATGSVDLDALPVGTWLCVGTDEGNIASVQITGRSPLSLILDFEVWKPAGH